MNLRKILHKDQTLMQNIRSISSVSHTGAFRLSQHQYIRPSVQTLSSQRPYSTESGLPQSFGQLTEVKRGRRKPEAVGDPEEYRHQFNKLPYLLQFLQDGKNEHSNKLFPSFGPVKVARLSAAMGGEEHLLQALEDGNAEKMIKLGKLKPDVADMLCNVWKRSWSHRPRETALQMIQIAGLPQEWITRKFQDPIRFELSFNHSPYQTLQVLNERAVDRKRFQNFLKVRKVKLSVKDRICFLAKTVLSESSQVCLRGEELRLLVEKERDDEVANNNPDEDVAILASGKIDNVPVLETSDADYSITNGLVVTLPLLDHALMNDTLMTFRKEDDFYYLYSNWLCEQAVGTHIAERLSTLSDTSLLPRYDLSVISPSVSQEQGVAIEKALQSRMFLLTGGPGTGKTYCFGQMLRAWEACGTKVIVASYTARSANNLKELAGAAQATTIHDVFEAYEMKADSSSRFRKRNLQCDVFVLDEATLVDLRMMKEILSRLDRNASFIMLGDPDQLPSISPGSVFSDLLDDRLSPYVPKANLKEPRRQQGTYDSPIHKMAQSIKLGRFPDATTFTKVSPNGLSSIDPSERAVWVNAFPKKEYIQSIIQTLLRLFSHDNIQVLVSSRAEYHNSTFKQAFRQANPVSRKHMSLGTTTTPSLFMSSDWTSFVVGDRVMHTKNDKPRGVLNGQIGYVIESSNRPVSVRVSYDKKQTNIVEYNKVQLLDLTLAYAMSVHKSQGCEFPIVVCIMENFKPSWTRQMLFTACTRAKERLFIIGVESVIKHCIASGEVRNSNLVNVILDKLMVTSSSEPVLDEASEHEKDVASEINAPEPRTEEEDEATVLLAKELTVPQPSEVSSRLMEFENYEEDERLAVQMKLASEERTSLIGQEHQQDNDDRMPSSTNSTFAPMQSASVPLFETDKAFAIRRFHELGLDSWMNMQTDAVASVGSANLVEHTVENPLVSSGVGDSVVKAPMLIAPFSYLSEDRLPKSDKQAKENNEAYKGIGSSRTNKSISSTAVPRRRGTSSSSDNVILVPSSMDQTKFYEVNLSKKTCTCMGFKTRQRCRHLDSAMLTSPG